MKRVYVLIAVLAIGIVAGAWYLFSHAFGTVNYENELAAYLSEGLQAGTLSAEYDGETHAITSETVDGLLRVLRRGASEAKRVGNPPEHFEGLIRISMGRMTLNLYLPSKDEDEVIMERVTDGRSVCTSLKGYDMFRWVLKATGFEN